MWSRTFGAAVKVTFNAKTNKGHIDWTDTGSATLRLKGDDGRLATAAPADIEPGVRKMPRGSGARSLRDAEVGSQPYVVTPEEHGAFGDGHRDDSKAIAAAIASCVGHEQCRVVLAKSYLSGPFRIASSGTTLEITGNFTALPRVDGCVDGSGCYPRSAAAQAEFDAFITAVGLRDVTLTGRGRGSISFGGARWWPCKQTGCWRPHLLEFTTVTNLAVADIVLRDPANHFAHVNNCSHVRVERVTMTLDVDVIQTLLSIFHW